MPIVSLSSVGLIQTASLKIVVDPSTNSPKINSRTGTYYDKRGSLTNKAVELNLSNEWVRRIRETSGIVYCGAPVNGKFPSAGSGALVSNDIIWTAFHVLFNKATGKPLADHCFFRTQWIPSQQVEVELYEGSYKTIAPERETKIDAIVLARLKEKIDVVRPIPLADLKDVLWADRIFMVSSWQKYMSDFVDSHEPIAQDCGKPWVMRRGLGPAIILADCSTTKGASGSIGYIRVNNQLVQASVLIGDANADDDNWCKFDIDGKCYSISLSANPKIAEQLPALENRK